MRALVIASSLLLWCASAWAQGAREGEDDSAALVDEGRRELRARHYDDAARALDQAIALNPRRIEAYVLRAAVHAAKQEYDDGIALLRKAQKLDKDNADVLASLGAQLVWSGATEEGVGVLEQVVAVDPHRYDAQLLLGRHRAKNGAWKAAVVALEAYLADRPKSLAGDDAVNQTILAEAYLRAHRPADAEKTYARVLEVRPDEPAARLGQAWAIAALDCTRAKKVLAKLSDLVVEHPEILLVRGQCELALGDGKAALREGKRYLRAIEASKGSPAAAGHALVGEAAFATGDLALAKSSLEAARDAEPAKRRWAVKLATVLRRSDDAEGAVAELDRLGPPEVFEDDPAWWYELGESLIASGKPEKVESRYVKLTPLPEDGELLTILGEADVRAGAAGTAYLHLLLAEQRRHGDERTVAWLARAALAVAAEKTAAGDYAGAEEPLSVANKVADSADVARNLGIVRMQLGRDAEATAPLERAVSIDPAPESLLALGQAYARTGANQKAREAYRKAAAKARGETAVLVAIELAGFELANGDPDDALDAIDNAGAAAKKGSGALAAQYRNASMITRHAAGIAAMRAGSAGRAVTLLEGADALAGSKDVTIKCDLALATVAAGDRDKARRRLLALKKVTCPFPAPADTQAVPILLAFTEGLDAKKADRSLKTLAKLAGKATGATARLLATATRVVAITAADQAYRAGKIDKARKLLATARKAETRVAADELAHDTAVIDIADGKLDAAATALEKLTPKLPEALVNLGVVADQRGDADEALAKWRAAKAAGADFDALDDWIAAKQRILGGAR